jgi:hypothetical protein
VPNRRSVIVHIGKSADGYIARPDGDLEWLTSRRAPAGSYGMNAFMDQSTRGSWAVEPTRRACVLERSSTRSIAASSSPAGRDVPLELISVERFDDGLVQTRYRVQG